MAGSLAKLWFPPGGTTGVPAPPQPKAPGLGQEHLQAAHPRVTPGGQLGPGPLFEVCPLHLGARAWARFQLPAVALETLQGPPRPHRLTSPCLQNSLPEDPVGRLKHRTITYQSCRESRRSESLSSSLCGWVRPPEGDVKGRVGT